VSQTEYNLDLDNDYIVEPQKEIEYERGTFLEKLNEDTVK